MSKQINPSQFNQSKSFKMRSVVVIFFCLIPLVGKAQETFILQLEKQKEELSTLIGILNDSIKKIDLEITKIKTKYFLEKVSESTLKGEARKGAKIKKSPDVFSEILTVLSADTQVIILDYINNYFGVCVDSICGYMSEIWIVKNNDVSKFVKLKELEEIELEKIKKEQEVKTQEAEWEKLQEIYIQKYGDGIYQKLKQGKYWIGMTKEMAIIALGNPNKINRTVGSWGVHEQWVYNGIFLYFENEKLASFQN